MVPVRPPRKYLAYIVILGFICQMPVTDGIPPGGSRTLKLWLRGTEETDRRKQLLLPSLPPLFLHPPWAVHPQWAWSTIQGNCLESIPYRLRLGMAACGLPPTRFSGRRQRAMADSAPSLYLECFQSHKRTLKVLFPVLANVSLQNWIFSGF